MERVTDGRAGRLRWVIDVGCMTHARRKFFELHKANQSSVAGEALQRISVLYEIESRGRELANAERHELQAETLDGTISLRAERGIADRQQPGRKRDSPDCTGQKELVIHRLRTLRAQRRRHPKLAGHRQT